MKYRPILGIPLFIIGCVTDRLLLGNTGFGSLIALALLIVWAGNIELSKRKDGRPTRSRRR